MEVDVIQDIDEYQTWPGWMTLGLRVVIMVWFLCELRATMTYEHNATKLHFFLHFGAASLVWFIYLPVVALIALQISPLWRYKLLLGGYYIYIVDRHACLHIFRNKDCNKGRGKYCQFSLTP